MYPASTPLVPDDQFRERDFAPRDLDAERDLNGSDWCRAYARRTVLQ